MKFTKLIAAIAVAAFSFASPALAEVAVGDDVSSVTFTDSKGNEHTVSDFAGKTVVFEWHNPECPFVVKHYKAKNMQETQSWAKEQGAVWISVNSAAEGKQGYFVNDVDAKAYLQEAGAEPTAYVLDHDGSLGKHFGAKTTPHMFIVNGEGKVVYAGAIDSVSSADPADIEGATNYVKETITALNTEGVEIETATTKPYGCSVKY